LFLVQPFVVRADINLLASAHEKPFGRWFSWDDEADELVRISELLQACREKKVQLAPLQVFLPSWYSVPTMPPLLRHHSYS